MKTTVEEIKIGKRVVFRTVPIGAIKLTEKFGLAVAYVVNNYAGDSRILVKAFIGNAGKAALYFTTRKPEYAQSQIAELFRSVADRKQRVKQSRQLDNEGHSIQVGEIITNSWGYDQTNVDWYRVVRVSRNFVWLQPIAGAVTETGNMSGHAVAAVDTSAADPSAWNLRDLDEPIEQHKASGRNVRMKYGSGRVWDGSPVYESWYH